MSTQITPGLQTTIQSHIERRELNTQTTLIGKIVSYDHSTQTASVKPEQAEVWRDDQGQRYAEDFPVIKNVPVAFPRGGGFSIVWPLSAGDPVHVICTKYSFDKWRNSGLPGDQGDLRKFGLSGAIAYPVNVYKGNAAIDNAEAGFMVLSAGGTVEKVARADRVEGELAKIKGALDSIASAVPTTNSYSAVESVGADKIKVE